jgi:hypothetical protein
MHETLLNMVTQHIDLVATISSTYNAPDELARQLTSLDHLRAGRAVWNVVTTFSNSIAKDVEARLTLGMLFAAVDKVDGSLWKPEAVSFFHEQQE